MTLVKPPFHIGSIVDNLERGMDEMSQAFGLTWGRVQRRTLTFEGPLELECCYAYSLDGPPYMELIEQRPGTHFGQLGLHHIGMWTENPAAESERLDAIGWPRETVIITPEGTWGGALFHTGTCGIRVEVVDIARSGPRLCHYLGGGDYSLPG